MTTPAAAANNRFEVEPLAERIDALAHGVLRFGLAGILIYLGAFKFTAVEAAAIQPLIANSPLVGWLYSVAGTQAVSNLIGGTEMVIGTLIAARWAAPRAAALGGLAASGIFLTTLSFLISTPGIWQQASGFPLAVPSEAGAFLLKDVFLFGASLAVAAEALRATRKKVSELKGA